MTARCPAAKPDPPIVTGAQLELKMSPESVSSRHLKRQYRTVEQKLMLGFKSGLLSSVLIHGTARLKKQ